MRRRYQASDGEECGGYGEPEKLEKAESAFPVSSSSSSSDKRPSMHEIIDANARPIEEEKVINDTSEDSMDDVVRYGGLNS